MKHRKLICLMLFSTMPMTARANGFLPTMISANILWLLALPLVVAVEGWMMKRWGWNAPFKNCFWANFWSMIAAIPIGFVLSFLGGYLGGVSQKTALSFIPETVKFNLSQVLLYGQLPAPSYGYINGYGTAGISLAGLIFIGICWLLTFGVEGRYYRIRNPFISTLAIYCGTALSNLSSYSLILAMWLPYSYMSAAKDEAMQLHSCQLGHVWSPICQDIWDRYPETKDKWLLSCLQGFDSSECFKRLTR